MLPLDTRIAELKHQLTVALEMMDYLSRLQREKGPRADWTKQFWENSRIADRCKLELERTQEGQQTLARMAENLRAHDEAASRIQRETEQRELDLEIEKRRIKKMERTRRRDPR